MGTTVGFTKPRKAIGVHHGQPGHLSSAGVNETCHRCEQWKKVHDKSVPTTSLNHLGHWLMPKQAEFVNSGTLNFRPLGVRPGYLRRRRLRAGARGVGGMGPLCAGL